MRFLGRKGSDFVGKMGKILKTKTPHFRMAARGFFLGIR